MWAASALPVRREYVSFQVSVAPVLFSTYFALNAPFASRALFGFDGLHYHTVIERTNWIGVPEAELEPEPCGLAEAVTA